MAARQLLHPLPESSQLAYIAGGNLVTPQLQCLNASYQVSFCRRVVAIFGRSTHNMNVSRDMFIPWPLAQQLNPIAD